jgi:hypothetical protein
MSAQWKQAAFNGHTTQVTAMGLFPIAGAMER